MFGILKDNKMKDAIENARNNYNNARVGQIDATHDLKTADVEVMREKEHLELVELIALEMKGWKIKIDEKIESEHVG